MKKKFLVFILVFCLSTTFISYSQKFNDLKEVKAAAFTLPLAIGFFGICLNMLGVTYYKNGQGNLNGDLADFATSKNVSITSLMSPYANVVVDVGKKVAKFSAAQIYLCKEFISYLKSKNEISISSSPTFGDDIFNVGGLTSCMRIYDGDVIKVYRNDVVYDTLIVNNPHNDFIGLIYTFHSYSSTSGLGCGLSFFSTDYNYNFDIKHSHNNTTAISLTSQRIFRYTSLLYPFDTMSENIGKNYIEINGTRYVLYNVTAPYNNDAQIRSLLNDRFKFSEDAATDSPALSNNVNLTDYYYKDATVANDGSILNNVGDEVDDTKPAVIYVPQIIDKAIDNAKKRDSNATTITEADLIQAIDDTAVGVINPDSTDEEEKVIAPPLDLDISKDLTQDDAVADTIVEDLAIPEDDDPSIPEPPIIDINIGTKFPFSVFYDFVAIMNLFDATPVAPSFPLGFEFLGNKYEFTVDLSDFDSVARILRLMELIAFISGLVVLTIKYIRGKD